MSVGRTSGARRRSRVRVGETSAESDRLVTHSRAWVGDRNVTFLGAAITLSRVRNGVSGGCIVPLYASRYESGHRAMSEDEADLSRQPERTVAARAELELLLSLP